MVNRAVEPTEPRKRGYLPFPGVAVATANLQLTYNGTYKPSFRGLTPRPCGLIGIYEAWLSKRCVTRAI
jgi:hypothetical protein